MLRVQLLGEVTVERDGATVDAALLRPVTHLLAFLALHPGPHARDALAERFWPGAPTATGRARLRTAVWTLRRVVGADVVLATRTSVGLDPERVWVDAAAVARHAAADEATAAVALCRGDLLADRPEDWAVRAREEHREREAALLDRLATDAENRGDDAAAVRWSRRRCALTPLDEPAHAALLGRLAATGRRADALVVARELVARLRDELGVAPDPATRAAIARLRGPAGPEAPAHGPGLRPLFGRRAEMATLAASWSAARAGQGRVVLVTGEGGLGKTRLVTELAGRADNVGARVAVGAGIDVGGEAPLALWQELARQLARIVPTPPDTAGWPAELGRLAPDLARALERPAVPAPVAAPELERLRIADAVLRLVEWACAGRPVLLVAEDVHRADRASLQLAAHLGRRVAGLPLLLVLTRRDRPARPGPDALVADLAGRGVPVDEVVLGPLADAELASVVHSVAPLDDADVARATRA
ncbi:MAG TPA: AAA family ATPase, partial [Actinomycetospora sp.]|nr:AAA family ATPase [Actinomycetospora sp.]